MMAQMRSKNCYLEKIVANQCLASKSSHYMIIVGNKSSKLMYIQAITGLKKVRKFYLIKFIKVNYYSEF